MSLSVASLLYKKKQPTICCETQQGKDILTLESNRIQRTLMLMCRQAALHTAATEVQNASLAGNRRASLHCKASQTGETGDTQHSRFHFLHHRAHPELAYSFVVQLCSSITLWCDVMWCCCVFFSYSAAFLNCPLGINEVNWIELNWTKLNIYTLIRRLIRVPDTSNLTQYSCHWVEFTLAASKLNHEIKNVVSKQSILHFKDDSYGIFRIL